MSEFAAFLVVFVCGLVAGLKIRDKSSRVNGVPPNPAVLQVIFLYETFRRARLASDVKENQAPVVEAEQAYRGMLDRAYEEVARMMGGKYDAGRTG